MQTVSVAKVIDNRKEAQCDGCGKIPIHSARLELGIKLCWSCAYYAFNALEDVRNPDAMYLYPARSGEVK